jgi:CheY-like chemotaxis protein
MATSASILLAEDDENDILLLKLALNKAGISDPLTAVRDGQRAIEYLERVMGRDGRVRGTLPALFLTDLKMPRMNGFDVLAWLRQRAEFDALPVVVLSSSDLPEDMEKAQQLGADDYKVKCTDLYDLSDLVRELHERWVVPAGILKPFTRVFHTSNAG